MVLPLLGLLALGGTAYAAPHLRNREARIQGEYQNQLMEGIDANDPNATRSALFGGGLLSGPQFQSDIRTGFEGLAGREQSDVNSRRAAGSAAASLAQRQREFDYNVAKAEADAQQMQMAAKWTLDNFGTGPEQAVAANPYSTPQQLEDIAAKTRERASKSIDTGPIIEQYREAALLPTKRLGKANQILDLLPDATQFAGEWWDDPANTAAKDQAERLAFELRQEWIDTRISQGREPSDKLQARAEKLFPTDLGVLNNRQRFVKNLTAYMLEQQTELDRLGVDFQSRVNGNALNILNTYPTGIPGQVSAGEVIPD